MLMNTKEFEHILSILKESSGEEVSVASIISHAGLKFTYKEFIMSLTQDQGANFLDSILNDRYPVNNVYKLRRGGGEAKDLINLREFIGCAIISDRLNDVKLKSFRDLFNIHLVSDLPRRLKHLDIVNLLNSRKITLDDKYKDIYSLYYSKNINPIGEDVHELTLKQLVDTIVFCEGFSNE